MRMILIALLTMVTTASAWAVELNYDFKPGTQCENPNHTVNMTALAEVRDKITQVVEGEEEVNLFNLAWLETIKSEDITQHEGFADYLVILKNYPNVGMFVAFKDGCYKGYVNMPLDLLNKVLYAYSIKSKGI